jgi:hypothetical protein
VVADFVGGPETTLESGEVAVTYHVIGAGKTLPPDDAGTWSGLRIARGERTIDLLATEEASAPVLFDLALAGMADAPAIAVVLDGLELRTDVAQTITYPGDYNPADGYSTRGIGAAIANVMRQGTDLHFDVSARFALGRRDRDAMNRAVVVANTRAVVHFLVIAIESEPARATIAYRQDNLGHGDRVLAVCRPDPSVTMLRIDGAPLANAAPALTSFSLRLFPDEDGIGDDVRELSIRIDHFAYDPPSGDATMNVEGYATNEGPPPPFLPMSYEVAAEVVLLAWSGPATSEEMIFRAPIVAGRNEIPLPLTP